MILKSGSVKLCLFLHFRFLVLCLPCDSLLRLLMTSKRERKTSKSGNL